MIISIHIHQEPLTIELQGKSCFIAHGDGFAANDVGYRRLKRILRHPLNIKLYRMIHPDLGFTIADFFSKWIRNNREIKNKENEYLQYAKNRFIEGFECVVLAHTHQPQEHTENGKCYINTGDWVRQPTWVVWDGGHFNLCSEDGAVDPGVKE